MLTDQRYPLFNLPRPPKSRPVPNRPTQPELMNNTHYKKIYEHIPKYPLNNNKYLNVMNEVIQTEETYCNSLSVIIKGFKANFEQLQCITKDQVDVLFSNIEDIYEYHVKLLSKMKDLKESGHSIAGVFLDEDEIREQQVQLKKGELADLYGVYCGNHTQAAAALNGHYENQKLKAFFLGCRLLVSQDINIEGFLLVPIQRLCRYPLLFKELLKCIDAEKDEENYSITWIALEKMKSLAEIVNESKRKEENEKLYLDLCKTTEGLSLSEEKLATKNTQLIRSYRVKKLSGGKLQGRILFILDGMLCYGKKKSTKSIICGSILWKDLEIDDVEDGAVVHGTNLTFAWRVERKDSKSKTYYILMKSEKEKAECLAEIRRILKQ